MSRDFIFTSESVSEGHPDKVADQISDGVLDAILAEDPDARVACESIVNTGMALVFGEITTSAYVDISEIARETIGQIGYTDPDFGFDHRACSVMTAIDEQSGDIAAGVDADTEKEQGAGDQGLMFGYASNETDELMPMPIMMSHKLLRRLAEVRRADNGINFLGPDSKSQVTVRYEDDKPVAIDAVVLSTQHRDGSTLDQVKTAVMDTTIKEVIPENLLHEDTKYHINPTGRFVEGGPKADGGLTGRKIIVDTYGGMGKHGGGAFSGKDPSKVDRSAAYQCRYIAKNLVAAGLADRCDVQLAYAIGVPEPVSVMVNTYGTGTVDEEEIEKAIREVFALKPADIIRELELLTDPNYKQTAAYGHFGWDGYAWEETDKAPLLEDMLL